MSKHKLLLADDSITVQKVVSLTFADAGIEVISVGDGNSAMEKFAEFAPDLVMADIHMPGLSGYEICEQIKQNKETRAIPVILLVGAFESFDEVEAKRVGADDHLTKPFQSIQQLVTKVHDLLNADAGASGSFDNTLEVEKESSEKFGDAEMDDKMIQADAVDDYADERSESEDNAPVELDEANLLELPSREYFLASLIDQKTAHIGTDSTADAADETGDVEPDEIEEIAVPGETEETDVSDDIEESAASDEAPHADIANISPEMIDAIAAKVVEKISDKVIREIAWEVVPQMTELIVKRMAEEKREE